MLQEVRQKGYALDNEEWILGVRAIAAPVFNMQGRVEGAVNMPVISAAVSRNKLIKEFVPLLLAATDKISSSLGYMPGNEGRRLSGSERKNEPGTESRKCQWPGGFPPDFRRNREIV